MSLPIRLLLFLPWLILCSCERTHSNHSELFTQIFISADNDFRGVNLGQGIQDILTIASPLLPKYQDRYGVSYEIKLVPSGSLRADYYTDNLISGMETNKIASIVAQVSLDNEVETARLYQEIKEYFDLRYNLPAGVYGDYLWSSATRDFGVIEVRLRLDDSKRGIVFNFVDPQAGTRNEPS